MSAKKSSNSTSGRKHSKGPGLTGWAIIFLSVFIVVFLVSMLIPQSEVKIDTVLPATVRLQLQNGCGVKGAAEEMTKAFVESSSDVVYDIIDKSNAETYNFDKTMVIDRIGDSVNTNAYSKAALVVAERLGVGPDQLILQRLSDNLLDIDVTVIIGADYRNRLNALLTKEK